MTKRDLGMCALVCTFWADKVQPQIFNTIVLRCADDVRTLVSFFESGYSRVSEFINHITLEQTVRATEEPWIHLTSVLLTPKRLGYSIRLSVTIPNTTSGPHTNDPSGVGEHPPTTTVPGNNTAVAPAPHPPFRSLLASLPRAIPSLLVNIYDLDLSNISLRKFADFAHLVSELPELRSLTCEHVTWPDHSVTLPPPARLPKVLGSVVVVECPDYWSFVWLFIGPNRLPPKVVPGAKHQSLNLNTDDRVAMSRLLKLYKEAVIEAFFSFHHSGDEYCERFQDLSYASHSSH